jgi:hypothetical protein
LPLRCASNRKLFLSLEISKKHQSFKLFEILLLEEQSVNAAMTNSQQTEKIILLILNRLIIIKTNTCFKSMTSQDIIRGFAEKVTG